MTFDETAGKKLIRTCMQLYGKGDLDAMAPLVRDDYADHGVPFLTSAKEEWLSVTMLSHRSLPGGELDIAVADVFRLQDGQIAERWEVVQPIPRTATTRCKPFSPTPIARGPLRSPRLVVHRPPGRGVRREAVRG